MFWKSPMKKHLANALKLTKQNLFPHAPTLENN